MMLSCFILRHKIVTSTLKKIVEAIKNIKCHQTEQESSLMLPSRAIGNFLFPTYEVVITSLSYSSALMSERIKCSIPLVDNHINIHRAIHAVC